jgi:toxin ParE1/3/4
MKREIRISRRARWDFADIRDYISRHDPEAAERLHQRIGRTIDLLAEFPYIGGPTVKPGVLMTVVPRYGYKIYYAVSDGSLDVVHIRHPARQEPGFDDL